MQASSRVSRVHAGLLATFATMAWDGLGWPCSLVVPTVLRTVGFLVSLLLHTSEGPPSSATINGSVSGLSATPLPPIPTLSLAVSYHEVVLPGGWCVGRGGAVRTHYDL